MADYRLVEFCAPGTPNYVRIAASFAGKLAAELGAQVIKVEPPCGDPLRLAGPLLTENRGLDSSALFQFLNTSKTSCFADSEELDDPTLLGVIDSADVVLAGCEDSAGPEQWPNLPGSSKNRAWVTVHPFNLGSVYPGSATSELTVLAMGGLLQMVGDPAREPLRLAGHQASYAAGLSAFLAIGGSRLIKNKDGCTRTAVGIVDVVKWVNWKASVPGSPSMRQGSYAEWQVAECADGHIALVFQASDWPALKRLAGSPELDNPRFATPASRRRFGPELLNALRPWLAARSKAQLLEEALEHRIPLGPVLRPHELLLDPQYRERAVFGVVEHASLGELRMPRMPVRINGRAINPKPAPLFLPGSSSRTLGK